MKKLFARQMLCFSVGFLMILSLHNIKQFDVDSKSSNPSYSMGDTKNLLKISESPEENVNYFSVDAIPEKWDWRDAEGKDWTTPIKNQLQDICGSCWAFGTLAGLEAEIKIWMNDPELDIDLSEQYMLSCSPGDCDGWYMFSTLNWIKNNGAIPETCLSYEADDTIPCDAKCSDWREYLIGVDNYHSVRSDVESIQTALLTFGPLPTTMDVYSDFYPNYTGGVYTYQYGDYVFGHVVTIVGYDDTWGDEEEGYWIVKNSWGTDWGEEGWFRIAYGECNIEKSTYYFTGPNFSPDKPEKPEGTSRGKAGEVYSFSAIGIDPDDDNVRLCFDWGDGNITKTGIIASGEAALLNYSWKDKGTYLVRVYVEDEHGLDSDWSNPLQVSMPKTRINQIKIPGIFMRFTSLIDFLFKRNVEWGFL